MKKSILTPLLVILAFLATNVVANWLSVRLDFTADQKYTLSPITKTTLKDLGEKVTIKAYFTADLPPELKSIQTDFKAMLTEYHNVSNGKVDFLFINPNEDEAIEKEAIGLGIVPNIINIREKDQATQKKVFLGAIVEAGDSSGTKIDRLPIINPDEMEYSLTKSIKRLTGKNKPTLGLLTGHGEIPAQAIPYPIQELGVLYQLEMVDLSQGAIKPSIGALVVLSPQDSFLTTDLQKIENYLASGGNILLGIDRVTGNMQEGGTATALNTGLETWLLKKGIEVVPNIVIDQKCSQVEIPVQAGSQYMQAVDFPYIPAIVNFGKHPITLGLEGLFLDLPSEIKIANTQNWEVTPLLLTSNHSNKQAAPVSFELEKEWSNADFPLSSIPLGVAITGKFGNEKPSKMVIIGDGGFVTSDFGQNQDNVSLLVNSVSWLMNDTALNQLRTKNIVYRPLREMDDTAKNFIKWLGFLFPIFLVIGYGIIRMQRKKSIRQQRML